MRSRSSWFPIPGAVGLCAHVAGHHGPDGRLGAGLALRRRSSLSWIVTTSLPARVVSRCIASMTAVRAPPRLARAGLSTAEGANARRRSRWSVGRKERFFVTTQAAGLLTTAEMNEPSIPLAIPLSRRLATVLGLDEVPVHAYAAVDYHLSWLHAGLAWWNGDTWPGQGSGPRGT